MSKGPKPNDADYAQLLRFRDGLRQFLWWSENQAKRSGLTPAQHQLLLAIRGHAGGAPSVGEVAQHLMLRHHSVVGLVDRAVACGLVARVVDNDDHRVVRLELTEDGARRLGTLSAAHLGELARFADLVRLIS